MNEFEMWQPIETAPKDGTWVLLTGGVCEGEDHDTVGRPVVGQWTCHLNGRDDPNYGRWQFAWYDGGYYGEYKWPMHWLPLPKAPVMDCQQRASDASAYHQSALRRVAETPPPAGQKFKPGTRVKIADTLGPHMIHFPAGKLATVQYTSAHAFGSTDERSLQQYSLDIDGIGSVAWYDECQLSLIEDDQK